MTTDLQNPLSIDVADIEVNNMAKVTPLVFYILSTPPVIGIKTEEGSGQTKLCIGPSVKHLQNPFGPLNASTKPNLTRSSPVPSISSKVPQMAECADKSAAFLDTRLLLPADATSREWS
jgi:hypothetical protein